MFDTLTHKGCSISGLNSAGINGNMTVSLRRGEGKKVGNKTERLLLAHFSTSVLQWGCSALKDHSLESVAWGTISPDLQRIHSVILWW